MPAALRSRVSLALLTLAVGFGVLTGGGDLPLQSNIVVLLVGLGALVGVSHTDRLDARPRDVPLLAASLLPLYIIVQLVPLPLALVRIVSPARAEIADALNAIGVADTWVPLSVSASWTSASLSRVAGCVLVFALVRQLGRLAMNRWAVVVPLIVIALLEAAVGLSQAGASGQQGGTPQVVGTYFSRNHFAGFLEIVLPLALACGIQYVSRRRRRHELATEDAVKGSVLLVVASVLLIAILLSTSRGGSLASGASLLVMGALNLTQAVRGWRRWAAICGLAVVLAAAFVFIMPTPLIERFGARVEDEPNEGRYPIWQDTIHLAAAYPLVGVGYGNFYTAFFPYQTTGLGLAWTAAHNDHLQLLAELGMVGYGLVVLMIGGAFVRAVSEENDRYVAVGCAGAIAAFAFHAFVEFNAYVLANALTLSWVAGLAASFRAPAGSTGQGVGASPMETRSLTTFAGALVTAWSVIWIVFLTTYNRDPLAEQAFCRFGVCDTDAVFAALQGEERETAPKPVPVDAQRRFLLRDPASPDRWSFYGEALQAAGRTSDARTAFERSIALSPRAPQVLLGAADFYLTIGERARALELVSRSLEAGDIMDEAVFGQLEYREVPPAEVLAHVALDARASRVYLRRLMAASVASVPEGVSDDARRRAEAAKAVRATDASAVWEWMRAKGLVNDRTAVEYAEFLVRTGRPGAAQQAWAAYAGAAQLTGAQPGYPESNRVFDGDFEAQPIGGPFDWRIAGGVKGVATSLDTAVRHSGSRALKLAFDGTANVSDVGAEQSMFLPEGRYRLQAWMRSEGLTTDEGVGLRVVSQDGSLKLDVRTGSVLGTSEWRIVEAAFDVPTGGGLVRLLIARKPSLKFDNLVRGSVWIDELRIQRE